MSTKDDNKIIAEFMGAYSSTFWASGEEVVRWGFKDTHITERWHESKFIIETPYHSSWAWLMPVVEKIESIRNTDEYEVDIFGRCCDIGGDFEAVGETKIEATWKAVVKFIKWYNDGS